jgi:cephalosporin hydroxylase
MTKEFYPMRPQVLMEGLLDLITYIQQTHDTHNMTMIEIGSYVGESAVLFAQHFKEVICIDPFLNDYDPNDITCQYADLDLVYNKFLENIEPYKNISLIKDISDQAIENKMLKNKDINFVYIDGLHTYDQVSKDIDNYLPLIKNGFMGGHDYHVNWIGVKNAIDERLHPLDKTFADTSWIIKI